MNAALQTYPGERVLSDAEILEQARMKRQAAMHRIRAAMLDLAIAQIEMRTGEGEIGSGASIARLELEHARKAYRSAWAQIAYSKARMAEVRRAVRHV